MIVKLTWHGEAIGKLDVQLVWPPPLDQGALLPLLSLSRGGAAVSVVFQFSGALDALELDLARPVVLLGPPGGPSEVGAFQGHVEARFDGVNVHGFLAAPLGSRGAQGARVLIQREAEESGFAVRGNGLSGQLEIAERSGPLTFGASVDGSRSELRAYPDGGGVIEVRAERGGDLSASLNWRWPRAGEAESPWQMALRSSLEFILEQQSATLWLGFELAPEEEASRVPSSRVGSVRQPEARAPSVAAPRSERATEYTQAAPARRGRGASRVVLLGGVALALVASIAAALLWKPSGIDTRFFPAHTVSTGALQPQPTGSTAAGAAR